MTITIVQSYSKRERPTTVVPTLPPHWQRHGDLAGADPTAARMAPCDPVTQMPAMYESWDLSQEACYERSLGCVGILKHWLTRAFAAALKDGQATLSLGDLERHAELPGTLRQMTRDIQEGEERLAEQPGERTMLRTLLGLGEKPTRTGENKLPMAVNHQRQTAVSPPQRRVGQRNPVRDPVGVKQHVG